MTYDCIIIGLGPAGSSAAYYLAKKGLSVLALDKEKFPRHKPCGGCVSYKAEHLLPTDFKAVVNNNINGAVFSYKGRKKTLMALSSAIKAKRRLNLEAVTGQSATW
ncbi:MAG: FAD-dependent oxidoreductase [Nitrospirae bacterium]|nr:FAD-dependent oxidoreductase [Nitrospirota bacterium]